MREAVAIQMSWIGAPTVYYGDEAGMVGFTDPDNRRSYPWGNEDRDLIAYHRDLIHIHKKSEALRKGSLEILGGSYNVMGFGRFTENEKIAVVVNNRDCAAEVKVPVWRLDVPMNACMNRLMYSYEHGYHTRPGTYMVSNGELTLKLGPKSAIMLQYKK